MKPVQLAHASSLSSIIFENLEHFLIRHENAVIVPK